MLQTGSKVASAPVPYNPKGTPTPEASYGSPPGASDARVAALTAYRTGLTYHLSPIPIE